MLDQFKTYVQKEGLLRPSSPVLVAVSGGVDSVVLCHLLKNGGFDFAIAHVNFNLRGDDSAADRVFVESLATKLGVPFHTKDLDPEALASKEHISIQMAARKLRYYWFEVVRQAEGYHAICTAHHKDDVAETMLLNLVKGTGIAGLHGILPRQGNLVRPMLYTTKEEVLAYAKENNLEYREDASNAELKYERNRIRNEVLPLLKELNPDTGSTLAANAERFMETELLFNDAVQRIVSKAITTENEQTIIEWKLIHQHPAAKTLLFHILRPFGFNTEQVAQIEQVAAGQSGKQFTTHTHRLVVDRGKLIVTDIDLIPRVACLVEVDDSSAETVDLTLKIKQADADGYKISPVPEQASLDLDKLEFPLVLRTWEKGDYFYPFGMKKPGSDKVGKKKVSDYLVDAKVPLHEKEAVWVLATGKKICWLVGHRIDDRFKVMGNTQKILNLVVEPRK